MSAFAARQLVIPADPGHIKVPPPSAQTIRKYPEISDTLLDITMSPHTVKCLPFEAAYPNKLRKNIQFHFQQLLQELLDSQPIVDIP